MNIDPNPCQIPATPAWLNLDAISTPDERNEIAAAIEAMRPLALAVAQLLAAPDTVDAMDAAVQLTDEWDSKLNTKTLGLDMGECQDMFVLDRALGIDLLNDLVSVLPTRKTMPGWLHLFEVLGSSATQ